MDFVCGVFYTWNTPFYDQHVSSLLTLPRLLLKCAIPRSHLLTLLCFSTPNPSTHSLNIYLFYFFRALCKLECMCYLIQLFTCVFFVVFFFPQLECNLKKYKHFNLLTEFSATRKELQYINHSTYICWRKEYIHAKVTAFWLNVCKYGFTYLPSLYLFFRHYFI